MSTSPNPPAGWYPDPAGQGSRYWDGTRWTTNVQPTAAPMPTPAAPAAPVGAAPPPPPPPPAYAPQYAPASPTTPNAFLQGLQRLEPFPLMVVFSGLFLISTFFPWAELRDGFQTRTYMAWSGEGPWMLLGPSAEDFQREVVPSGTTDLLLLLPLAIGAVVLAVMTFQQRKRISYAREIMIGLTGLLALLLVIEIVTLNGVADDLAVNGGSTWGLYLAVVFAGGMTFAAVRGYLTSKGQ
jgi:hypothetical protein